MFDCVREVKETFTCGVGTTVEGSMESEGRERRKGTTLYEYKWLTESGILGASPPGGCRRLEDSIKMRGKLRVGTGEVVVCSFIF